MKVDLNLNGIKNNKIQFTGYKPIKSEHGDREYEFNYVYDDSKYDCYLELFSVETEDGNYIVTDIIDNLDAIKSNNKERGIKLESGKATRIDLADKFGIAPDEAFGYHYKLYPKNSTQAPDYAVDAGNVVNNTSKGKHEIYNIVTDRASTVSKGGAMKLVLPDSNNVLWVYDEKNNIVKNPDYDRASKTIKTIMNKIGGSLAGIEKDLDNHKLDNFTRIVTTPLFTDDSVSSHAYWNKNCFQMAHSLGNINNYTSLQKKLFAQGKNLVSDGAYVNEGLEGIHFQNILKWGEQSPYFYWIKISGLKSSPLSLGVFGERTEHVTHRLVNSPYEFIQKPDGTISIKSKKYDSKKPTYLQIYDDRLVNTKNLSDKELIKAYDKLQEKLAINSHNDSVVPYSFRIDPEVYKKNAIALSEYNKNSKDNKVLMTSGKGTKALAQFEYFGLDRKHESGFETWDANTDIAKLNFVPSYDNIQNLKNIQDPDERKEKEALLKRKTIEVQDYAVSSGQFWTRKTSDILNLNAAQHLRNISNKSADEIYKIIKDQSNGKVFPKDLDVTKSIVKNVLDGDYNLKGADSDESYDDIILRGLMDVPLDSIELGDDIAGTLASSMISKRAATDDQIGVSRFDLYKEGNPHVEPKYSKIYKNADKIFTKELFTFTKEILDGINDKAAADAKLYDNSGRVTDYGKYVIPLLTSEIARFAIIKAAVPKVEYRMNNQTGELSYDYKTLKNSSLLSMGIIGDSPEDEASQLINKLRKGIERISNDDRSKLATALWTSIKGTNLNSFELAEMIVSRTEAGLDWRIDATKDIADMSALRSQKQDFETSWNQIIDFWGKFTDGVREYHPNAYITAEVTDDYEIYNKGMGSKSGARFSDSVEAVKKLINEAGFTTIANYSYFQTEIIQKFGKLFAINDDNSITDVHDGHSESLIQQLGLFMLSGPLESLLYSYTFAGGNHDNCRALEGYAMDMGLVYCDLTEPDDFEHRQRAYKILHGMGYGDNPSDEQVNNYNYDRVCNLAVAKAESILSGMGKAKSNIGLSSERQDYIYEKALKALANISNSRFKGENFEANGFGMKEYPVAIDIVLEEMDYIEPDQNKRLTSDEKLKLKKASLEQILKPAMSKLLGQTEYIVSLLGNPTLYGGDEYGSTGYEHKTKNITLQNRNKVHEEWAEQKTADGKENPEYMQFIDDYNKKLQSIYNLRTKVQALNDGAPFLLEMQSGKTDNNKDTNVTALLRQSPNGAMAISLFNTTGLNHKYDQEYHPKKVSLEKISLENLPKGITKDMTFKNAKNPDEIYKAREYDGKYFIKRHVNGQDVPIEFSDPTLVLYHEPSFTGRSKTLYNPKFNIVSNPYSNVNKKENIVGSKLALMSGATQQI